MNHRVATLGRSAAMVAAMLLLATACGGGGGGGGFLPDDGDTNPLTITTDQLPEVTGAPYSTVLEASGGTPPYSWSLDDDGGTGFVLNEEGILRGDATPASGSYGLTVTVSDAAERSARRSMTLVVSAANALAIETTALPQAVQGVDYTALLSATGGNRPYRWRIINDGGTGFEINADGILSGVAPDGGSYGLTVEVSDDVGTTLRESFLVVVTGSAEGPLAIATETLPEAQEGQTYSAILQATGGQGDYLWTLVDDGRTGLRLRDDGVISGTAPAEGLYGITVAVADDVREVTRALTFTVRADDDPLAITTSSLPSAVTELPYAAILEATGGRGNYSWQLISDGGSGLSLSPSGVLSGVPTEIGTFGIAFRVSDGRSSVQGALTLSIDNFEPFVPLRITTETLPAASGTLYAASLQAEGGTPPYLWSLVNDGGSGLSLSPAGSLTGTSPAAGSYGLTVAVSDDAGASATATLTLEAGDTGNPTVTILSDDLGTATAGENYSFILRAAGGQTGTYTWSVVEIVPSRPSGLVVTGPDAERGVLTWRSALIEDDIPLTECEATFAVTVRVTDGGSPEAIDIKTLNLVATRGPADPLCQ